MAAAAALEVAEPAPGRLELRGALTFATAREAREQAARRLAASAGAALEIDCRGITAGDSAGLALLVDLLASARRAGRRLRISGLPGHLRNLAAISEVEELLERGV